MTVTAEQVREVAEELRTHDLTSLADSLDIFAKKLLWQSDPNAKAATAIRNAYYNDGVERDLGTSGDPYQWLRMAAAGREVFTSHEPRRFKRGDTEPTDMPYAYDEDGDLFRYVGPDHWIMKCDFGRTPGAATRFSWHEMTQGDGAIEALGSPFAEVFES
jgi:hypothetical protein